MKKLLTFAMITIMMVIGSVRTTFAQATAITVDPDTAVWKSQSFALRAELLKSITDPVTKQSGKFGDNRKDTSMEVVSAQYITGVPTSSSDKSDTLQIWMKKLTKTGDTLNVLCSKNFIPTEETVTVNGTDLVIVNWCRGDNPKLLATRTKPVIKPRK